MAFATCARTCAVQHGATLPCLRAERDRAALGTGGGWVGHWSLAAADAPLGGDSVGWSTCGDGDNSSTASWQSFEPDAGLFSPTCHHEDCALVGPGREGRRDTSCAEVQPCVCAWPATLYSIQNNYVVVESSHAGDLMAALPQLEARIGDGQERCEATDRHRDTVLAVCVPLLLLLSFTPWRQRWRAWRRQRYKLASYDASACSSSSSSYNGWRRPST